MLGFGSSGRGGSLFQGFARPICSILDRSSLTLFQGESIPSRSPVLLECGSPSASSSLPLFKLTGRDPTWALGSSVGGDCYRWVAASLGRPHCCFQRSKDRDVGGSLEVCFVC